MTSFDTHTPNHTRAHGFQDHASKRPGATRTTGTRRGVRVRVRVRVRAASNPQLDLLRLAIADGPAAALPPRPGWAVQLEPSAGDQPDLAGWHASAQVTRGGPGTRQVP
jgi:hypothetical protein